MGAVALAPSALATGGDDATTATPIRSLPFADTGDTSGLTDQFDVVCPFSGSTSPDAWYVFQATADTELLVVDLCNSAFDTKCYVLDASFNTVACNDDACGGTFRSRLITPLLDPGPYFVVVDGWSGDAGTYDLTVEAGQPCFVTCPSEATSEGEPCDDTGGIDVNGACNSTVFIISEVTCGDTVCGEAWALGGTRDVDFYRLAPTGLGGQDAITSTVTAAFDVVAYYIGENPDCGAISIVSVFPEVPCGETATFAGNAASTSETWWFVAVDGFDNLPCGSTAPFANDYVISWACQDDPLPDPCPQLGDANGDRTVDFADLLTVLANFGPCP